MKYTIYLVALVKRQGKVLLIRTDNYQHLPYLMLSEDYQPTEALKRYLSTTLGFDQITEQLYDVVNFTDIKDPQKRAVYIVYNVGAQSGSASIAEGVKYAWKKIADLQPEATDAVSYMLLDVAEHEHKQNPQERSVITDVEDTTKVIIYSDGGSRGNPGPSAAAYVILDASDRVIQQGAQYLGLTTNNQAEYQGILIALQAAAQIGARSIDFRSDSMLVVNQLNGVYSIRNRELWPTYERIQELLPQFESVKFRHVKREFNTHADGLVNKTLNEHAAQHV